MEEKAGGKFCGRTNRDPGGGNGLRERCFVVHGNRNFQHEPKSGNAFSS